MRSSITSSIRPARLFASLRDSSSTRSRSAACSRAASAANWSSGTTRPSRATICFICCRAISAACSSIGPAISGGRSGIGVASSPHGRSPSGSSSSRSAASAARIFVAASGR